MYDIKQFRPALYFLLLLGMTGFSLAVAAPAVWLLAVGVVALHAWLVRTGRFRPLPRAVATGITLLAFAVAIPAVRADPATSIITIGHFLVFLHLVKLFELRANRDYAQLLILSLLLMVAGAISTSSLAFGVMFIVFLFVALYVCMLFHLKVENDFALASRTPPRDRAADDATLKQDQRYLPRSMRRLAALVSVVAVAMAVLVFLFFPRGAGAGMFGQLQLQPRPLTGFSDEVSLGQINSIAQNTEIVAQVQLFKNDRLVEGTQPLLLRGQTHDIYEAKYRTWRRSTSGAPDRDTSPDYPYEPHAASGRQLPPGDVYRQKISLRPTGTLTLFALPGVLRFTPSRPVGGIRFFADDETLTVTEPLTQRFDYEVLSRNVAIEPPPVERPVGRGGRNGGGRRWLNATAADRRPDRDAIDPLIAQYARRPDVSGVDAQGQPLAAARAPTAVFTDLDRQIALNVEDHLRRNFGYTLDLTAENRDDAKDPIVQFLYDWRKGHCTYFASAMVLMCQSLGLQARMVTGFRCDEYDGAVGDYYVVRQSHAHAWVEVRTAAGWQTFDPTSGNDAGGGSRANSAWKSVKHFFDWLEFKWAEKVVAYDGERRGNLIANVETSVVNAVLHTRMNPNRISRQVQGRWARSVQQLNAWLNDGPGLMFSVKLLIGAIGLLVLVLIYGLFNLLRRRHLMRRRAARIGLDNLPSAEQMRLARQLGFYEQLTTLLEKRRIVRPRHQTPAEFSDGLTFLPNEAFDTIRRLTGVFYAVRFGRHELPGDEQRDLENTVRDLDPLIDGAPPIRA